MMGKISIFFVILTSIFYGANLQINLPKISTVNVIIDNSLNCHNSTNIDISLFVLHCLQFPVTIYSRNNYFSPVHKAWELLLNCDEIVVLKNFEGVENSRIPLPNIHTYYIKCPEIELLNSPFNSEELPRKTLNFNGSEIVVELGHEVDVAHKGNYSLKLEQIVSFSAVEETIPRQPFRSGGTRRYFVWAILQNRLNFTSVTLKRYTFLGNSPSPLEKEYNSSGYKFAKSFDFVHMNV